MSEPFILLLPYGSTELAYDKNLTQEEEYSVTCNNQTYSLSVSLRVNDSPDLLVILVST